eukprot:CCRYP_006750-RA/>CCRYP_006750-RA protein AED:0.45 eAED:0.45 QI:90/1/1/1/0/0/2/23/79
MVIAIMISCSIVINIICTATVPRRRHVFRHLSLQPLLLPSHHRRKYRMEHFLLLIRRRKQQLSQIDRVVGTVFKGVEVF